MFLTACSEGQFKLAELLIKHSAKIKMDFNASNFCGNTAFHEACHFGHKDIVCLILDNSVSCKIKLETKNSSGKTGYQIALMGKTTKHKEIVAMITSQLNL